MKRLLPVLIALLSLLYWSCDDSAPDAPVGRPVIEGWISSGGYPVVMFTSAIVPSQSGGKLSEMVIRWGKVTISDGTDTVILTGGMNKEFFPPYRYYTFNMKGVPGRTYTVVADIDGLHAEARCRMPEPTEIVNIGFSPVEGNDSLRSATLSFTAPPDCPAYYVVEMRDSRRWERTYPAMLGTVEARNPGEEISVPIYKPKLDIDSGVFVPQFIRGERIEVSLCRIEKEVYDFWQRYGNDVLFGGSIFVGTSQSLEGNIDGGLGVWSAKGVSVRYVEVP